MEIKSEERVSLMINFLVSMGMKEKLMGNPLAFHDIMRNIFSPEYDVDYSYGLIDETVTMFTMINGIGYTIQGPIFFVDPMEEMPPELTTGSFKPVKAQA